MNRDQILENRRKWIDYLKEPTTKKGRDRLRDPQDNDARCCLGHACHVLGVKKTEHGYEDEWAYAPKSVIEALGLWDHAGSSSDKYLSYLPEGKTCLANWNDGTNVTPQEIGAYLETVIEGGPNTPFKEIP